MESDGKSKRYIHEYQRRFVGDLVVIGATCSDGGSENIHDLSVPTSECGKNGCIFGIYEHHVVPATVKNERLMSTKHEKHTVFRLLPSSEAQYPVCLSERHSQPVDLDPFALFHAFGTGIRFRRSFGT